MKPFMLTHLSAFVGLVEDDRVRAARHHRVIVYCLCNCFTGLGDKLVSSQQDRQFSVASISHDVRPVEVK